MSSLTYASLRVFMMLKKNALSGRRPAGRRSGKYLMICGVYLAVGQRFLTDSSSYMGTLTNLMELSGNSSFSSERIYRRKSLFIISAGGVYSCTTMAVSGRYSYLHCSEKYFRKSDLLLKWLQMSAGRSLRFLPTRRSLFCLSLSTIDFSSLSF